MGWLVTRKGGKVSWDERFSDFRILDLELAKEEMRKQGKFQPRSRSTTQSGSSDTKVASEFAEDK